METQPYVFGFIPIQNVNVAQRRIRGVMTLEVRDKRNRVMDYTLSKPHFIKWSNEIHNATGGKSYGNIRVMHSLTTVGKICKPLEFVDSAKQIWCEVEVSDDSTWTQVLNGEYCGFSWGGYEVPATPEQLRYFAGLPDGGLRYIGCPIENSIVDNPNQPGTYFTIVNSAMPHDDVKYTIIHGDGREEVREIKNAAVPTLINTSYFEISNLAMLLSDVQFVWTGADDLQKDFDKARLQMIKILMKMVSNKISETKEDIAPVTQSAEPVITNTIQEETKVEKEKIETPATPPAPVAEPVPVTNAATPEVINSAVVAQIEALNIPTMITNAVNAAMAPINTALTGLQALLKNTPKVEGAPVTFEQDKTTAAPPVTADAGKFIPITNTALPAANGGKVNESDLAVLNTIRSIHAGANKQ